MTNENVDDYERQKLASVIESLHQRIIRRCRACPVFCIGHLQDAFDSAFALSLVKKRRPVLIYIHHDDNMLDLLGSEILIEFLYKNYIVWPWDISDELNRQILIEIWESVFPGELFIDFSIDQCPMLIGVMRGILMTTDSGLSLQYVHEILLTGDVLVHTNEELNLETLFCQLINFKEEFDKNEKYLLSDFVQKIGSNGDLVLEAAEYLSLNDAITIFSSTVLPLLYKYKIQFSIVHPSETFMKTTIQKINHQQINSLRLEASQFKRTMELASSDTFENVKSLILDNLEKIAQIVQIKRYTPNLIYLSTRYEKTVDFHILPKIFQLVPNSIKRFEIHCDLISCSHGRVKLLFTDITTLNTTVEYFVVKVGHTSRSLVNNCVENYPKCQLRTIIDFIKIMSNIRNVRIIINKGYPETFLDINEWGLLAAMCQKLEKITLKVIKNMSQDKQLPEKIQETINSLHNKRESITFEVKAK